MQGALAHSEAPWTSVVKHLVDRYNPSRSPIFQTMLQYWDFLDGSGVQHREHPSIAATSGGGREGGIESAVGEPPMAGMVEDGLPAMLRVKAQDDPTEQEVGCESKFELHLCLARWADGSLHAQLLYCRDLFEHSSMVNLLSHFKALIESVAAAPPTLPIHDLSIADKAELTLVRERFSNYGCAREHLSSAPASLRALAGFDRGRGKKGAATQE